MSESAVVEIPGFEFNKNQPDPPHVARKVIERDWPNEHGVATTFCVKEARNHKTWWLYAVRNKFRASNTLRTTVKEKAETWIEAVKTGRIRVKRD